MTAERHPIQDAAQAMREHWYRCMLDWPAPQYWSCGPGYSHPKCEEGMRLEKEFLDLLRGRKIMLKEEAIDIVCALIDEANLSNKEIEAIRILISLAGG